MKEASDEANLSGFAEQHDQRLLLGLDLLQGHGSIGKPLLQVIEFPEKIQLVKFKNILSRICVPTQTGAEKILYAYVS